MSGPSVLDETPSACCTRLRKGKVVSRLRKGAGKTQCELRCSQIAGSLARRAWRGTRQMRALGGSRPSCSWSFCFPISWAKLHGEDSSLKGTGTQELGNGVTVGLPAVPGVPWLKVGLRSGASLPRVALHHRLGRFLKGCLGEGSLSPLDSDPS